MKTLLKLFYTITFMYCFSFANAQINVIFSVPSQVCMGDLITLTATPIGAPGPYTFVWSNGMTTQTIPYQAIMSETLTVTVTSPYDTTGLGANYSTFITVNPSPIFDFGNGYSIQTGDTLSLSGPPGFTYLWSTGATNQVIHDVPTATTTYTLTVTNPQGCTASDDIIISIGTQGNFNVAISLSNPNVCEEDSVQLNTNVTGGTAPYTYKWNTGETTNTIWTTAVGYPGYQEFLITITDNLGQETYSSINVNPSPKPIVFLGPDVTTPANNPYTLFVNSGTQFSWNTGETTQSIIIFPPIGSSTYKVTATNPMGCSASDMVIVTGESIDTSSTCILTNTTICEGETITLCAAETEVANQYYYWQETSDETRQITISPQTSTIYNVFIMNSVDTTYKSITVTVVPKPIVNLGPDISDCSKSTFELIANGGKTYLWSTGSTSNKIFVSPEDYGFYIVTAYNANGCSASDDITVMVGSSPIWLENFTDSTNPLKINFYGEAYMDSTIGYSWDFGDGNTSATQSPSHIYAKPGAYTISLSVKNALGCSKFATRTIIVGNVECQAGFYTNIDNSTNTVTCTNYSTGNISNYFWNFGDGNASTLISPTYKYNKSGVYTIALTVINNTGTCINKKTETITVGALKCQADFTFFVDSLKQEGTFKAKLSGNSTAIYWEFGDGSMSTEMDVTHKFANAGFYKVTLSTVDASNMCFDQKSQVVLISNKINDCKSDFTYMQEPTSKTITLDNLSMGTNLNQFTWDLGDGTITNTENTSHTYSKSKFYTICLTSKSSTTGCKNTSCETIKIGEDPKPCLSKFAYTVDSTNREVALMDLSFGDITNWVWKLTDTDTSHQQSAIYTFPDSGYYKVKLTVSNTTTGCSNDYVDVIRVGAKQVGLKAGFIFKIDTSNASKGVFPVEFKGASYGESSESEWDFGDGSSNSTTIAPTHEYTEGDYLACLTLSNPTQGTKSTSCDSIHVNSSTNIKKQNIANFSLSCSPNPIKTNGIITFTIDEKTPVSISLYNITGSKVSTIFNKEMISGTHSTIFNKNNLPAGVYFVKLKTNKQTISQKLILLD